MKKWRWLKVSNEIPARLLNCRNAWLYQKIWKRIFLRNGQFSLVICGKCGSGKSLLGLEIIRNLVGEDWDVKKYTCYSAEQFADLVRQPLKSGTALLYDDAGLAMLSGDAQTTEIKSMSKIFQSIRSRNFVVILTLPSLFLLASSVRSQVDFYAEPLWIDYSKNLCHAKFQSLSTNPKSGKLYSANMVRFVKKISPITGLACYEKQKVASLAFDKPPVSMTVPYEEIKKERVMEFNEEAFQKIKAKRVGKVKPPSINECVAVIRKDKDSFVLNNRVSAARVVERFGVGITRAREVARLANLSDSS